MRKQCDCTFLETPPTFVPFVDFKERPQQWKWIGESFLFFFFFQYQLLCRIPQALSHRICRDWYPRNIRVDIFSLRPFMLIWQNNHALKHRTFL